MVMNRVQKILNNARKTQREAIEGMYEDICTIYVKKSKKDPITGITKNIDTILVKDEPCRLSFRTMPSTSDAMKSDQFADTINQVITLFIRPDLRIPAGSKSVITKFGNVESTANDHNITMEYSNSAQQKVHGSHQEIILMLDDKYGRSVSYG